jgi:hypothetical protein
MILLLHCETRLKFLIVWLLTVILRVVSVGILVDKLALRQILLPECFLYRSQHPSAFYVIILSRNTDAV